MKQSKREMTMRMTRKILLAAMTVTIFASCSEQLAETSSVVVPPTPEPQEVPIHFGTISNGTTRAEFYGAEAADLLNRRFVVSGYKGDASATMGGLVYDNYVVEWAENTANTSESNTNDWEYVGKGRIQPAIDNGVTQQSIKYWDYTKSQYDFIAYSTGHVTPIYEGTPEPGEVLVSAINTETATGTDGVAYTFEGRAADLHDCYIADLVTVKKASFGSPVVIRFRSLGTKVRIGIYETVPGYSVKDVKFYSAANTDDAQPDVPRLFSTTANEIYTQGVYTVYYPTVDDESDADNNQAHVKFIGIGDQSSVIDFGALNYTSAEDGEKTPGNVFLGRSSSTASMAGEAEGNYYTQYIPNEFGTNLNLRVDYTLESVDGTGETIVVRGATAQVPSIYTQWKAGYAYTYLFKITEKTNGHTGTYDPTNPDDPTANPDPAGLYPITFAAVVVSDEDDTQETITLVSTPSITTYQKGSNVLSANEYQASTGPIFVTVSENNDLVTLSDANAAVYSLNSTGTEADVVGALTYKSSISGAAITGRNGLVLTKETITPVSSIEYGVDGNTIPLSGNQAIQFTPTTAGTYAFVYTQRPASLTNDNYLPVTTTPGDDVTGLYRNFNLISATGLAEENVIYFSMDGDGNLNQEYPAVGQDSVDGLYVYESTPADRHACFNGEKAVSGHDYFDRCIQDNGVYYTKVIKVE